MVVHSMVVPMIKVSPYCNFYGWDFNRSQNGIDLCVFLKSAFSDGFPQLSHGLPIVLLVKSPFSHSWPMVFPMEFIPYFPLFRGRRTTTWNARARGPPACCARAPPPSTRPLQCIPGIGSVGFIILISSIYSPYKFHPQYIYNVGETIKNNEWEW